jgi:hypothetical protein
MIAFCAAGARQAALPQNMEEGTSRMLGLEDRETDSRVFMKLSGNIFGYVAYCLISAVYDDALLQDGVTFLLLLRLAEARAHLYQR